MTAIQFLRYAGLCLLLGMFGGGLADPAVAAEQAGPSASLFAAPFYSCVRNFYVATTGNDANAGTQSSPWLTIQHADSSARAAGDCINVAPGTYQANVLITHGGNAPTATGYVAYRCQTLDGCHVLAPGAGPLWGIKQPANFVVVDGFELDGNNALQTDGIASVCLLTSGDTYGTGNASHHIWALNNILHHCNLAGIALQNKEWYYAIHNTVYHNAFTSGFQGSGIAYVVVQCIESGNAACASGNTYQGGTGTYSPSGNDTAPFNASAGVYTPFHNVVAWNHVYDNMVSAANPIGCGSHTDGNGIIMDTFYDETTNTIAYPFQTLLAGNVARANGARGIHIYKTSNATVANNTAYGNGTDTCNNSFGLADLSQAGGSNNVWVNNVAQSVVTAANPSCGQYCGHNNIPLVAGNAGSIIDNNNTYLNNVTYGGVGAGSLTYGSTGVGLYNNDINYFSCSKNRCNTNPMLINPGTSNFALQAGSPAIAYGAAEAYLPASATDAGACASSLTNCPQTGPAVTSVNPSSGPAAGGTTVTVNGAGFTGATAVTFGAASGTGMTVVNDGEITVTSPAGAAGTVDIVVKTPAGASSSTTSDRFTYSAAMAPPIAGPTSATTAYDSSSNPISLSLSGGAANSVAVATPPGHGSATASGTSIVYTPATGYFGADSFTYTASNGGGTSTAAAVSITVSAPTISVSPGTLAGGTVGTPYSQALTASGGQAPYSFSTNLASGALPGGLTLSSSGLISGTPTASGTFTFTVRGSDSSMLTPSGFASTSLSLTISSSSTGPAITAVSPSFGPPSGRNIVTLVGTNFLGATAVKFGATAAAAFNVTSATQISASAPAGTGTVDVTVVTPGGTSPIGATDHYTYLAPPTASPVSAAVAYGSTKNAISLSLGGGAANSVTVVTSPAHGTATASGTSIVYTPATGYFGTDSFTYTASNGEGTSAAATASITVSAPTISVSPGTLASGTVGTPYSQTLTASGGQAPYSFSTSLASGTLPSGLTLSSSGVISGTPTASGTFTFTVRGTDSSTPSHANFTSIQLSMTISLVPVPIVTGIVPNGGPSSGGGLVTIVGTNFTGATTVKFGTTPATGMTVANSTRITATAPAGTGMVNVTVTSPAGTSAQDSADEYSYATSGGTGVEQIYSYQHTLGVAGAAGDDNNHFNQPSIGAVDSTGGRLFVADTANHRVQVLDIASLSVVATIGVAGISGSDNGHLNAPGGVGFDPATGHVIVADSGNERLQVFDGTNLAYLGTIGTTGSAGSDNGRFDQPTNVRVNAATRQLYVADQGNQRIQIFDSDSLAYLATLGTSSVAGSDNSHLNRPSDAQFDPYSGQVMVADTGNSRVQLFDAHSFAYAATLGGDAVDPSSNLYFGAPKAVAFDPSTGLVLIADDSADDRVQALDALTYRYVLTIGTSGSSGMGSDQFAWPAGIVADDAHARIFVSDLRNDRIQVFAASPPVVLASVLPGGRSVQLGNSATVFATMINTGSTALENCAITLSAAAPAGLSLSYQPTDAATNALVGTPNLPVSIAGNDGLQSFVISFQGTQPFTAPGMPLDFACAGTAPAPVAAGVDAVDLAMSSGPGADIVAVAATPSGNGVIELPSGGSAAFAVAASNVGAAAGITVSVDTGSARLPLSATICPSDPKTGSCKAPPAPSASVDLQHGDTPTFSVFVRSAGPIAFAPASSRIFVRFRDGSGGPRGSTSVAVETL